MTEGSSTVTGFYKGLSPADEASLAAFDRSFEPFDPDPELLSGAPARNLSKALADFVSSVIHFDTDRVARRNGWWSRFTGADLEAQLQFEVATRRFSDDMAQLSAAAAAARKAVALMENDIERLATSVQSHEGLAEQTYLFLASANCAAPNVARLQRRLDNLQTMMTSNRVVGAQMKLAIGHLTGLLDQYSDIEKRLFPLWRHHALAVAQGAQNGAANVIETLRAVRSRLDKHRSVPE